MGNRLKRIWRFIFHRKRKSWQELLENSRVISMDEKIRRLEPDPKGLFMEVFAKKLVYKIGGCCLRDGDGNIVLKWNRGDGNR